MRTSVLNTVAISSACRPSAGRPLCLPPPLFAAPSVCRTVASEPCGGVGAVRSLWRRDGDDGSAGRSYGGRVTDQDAIVTRILTSYSTITVVGASADPAKAAHTVPAHMQRHGWRIIPVNPRANEILGEPVYRAVADVPEQVGLVDVFRPSEQTPDIARQAVAAGATALWLQLGIASAEARAIAEAAGLLYVEDRCLVIEQRRLRLDAPA
jgi:uncharacterized protein